MRLGTKLAIGLIVGFVAIGGAGILFGSSALSGQQSLTDPGSGEPTATPAETPDETQTRTASATPTATEASTPTPGDEPTARPQSFALNESDIAGYVAAYVNDRRDSDLSATARTSAALSEMANNHSQRMANESEMAHNVGYGNSRDRYERNNLFDQCKFESERYTAVIDAKRNRLESIASVGAGGYDGATVNETERRVARAIADYWFSSSKYRDRLTYANARFLGVGIAISEDDEVYATANVC
ncbi:CAP domain-containing protein [Haloarcula litorea]|uniref:CAP domain-containing protein n=1 Tax=Haloarcula litorea TaxID=3032579 RepID=UPI0023E8ABEC|nr:CAP domain-containing protein [Halomicroarcula sp. GDY20]